MLFKLSFYLYATLLSAEIVQVKVFIIDAGEVDHRLRCERQAEFEVSEIVFRYRVFMYTTLNTKQLLGGKE